MDSQGGNSINIYSTFDLAFPLIKLTMDIVIKSCQDNLSIRLGSLKFCNSKSILKKEKETIKLTMRRKVVKKII